MKLTRSKQKEVIKMGMKAGHTTENIGAKLRLNEDKSLFLYLTMTKLQLEKFILIKGEQPKGIINHIFIEMRGAD